MREGSMTVSQTPVITGNTAKDGVPNNTYLSSGKTITIDAAGLSSGASIGVTTADTPTASSPAGIVENTNRASYQDYFTSDQGYAFQTDNNNIIQLGNSHTTHVYGTAWESDGDEHWQVCAVCGQAERNRGNHASAGSGYKHDADSHWQVCDTCGATINETAHTLQWVTDREATETADGSRHEACSVCGYTKDAVAIPALGHSFDTSAWVSDESHHWHVCATVGCDARADEAAHTFQWVTDREATETADGSRHEACSVCGYAKDAVTIPATGKPYVPKTGDDAPLVMWLALLLASGMAVVVLVRRRQAHKA